MPELPEVETIRRDLRQEVVGRRISGVTISGLRSVRRYRDPGTFVDRLAGRELTDVGRRGKYLLGQLDDGGMLVVHLGMSGQLRLAARAELPPPRHTHVRLALGGGDELWFIDPRTFGQLFVTLPVDGGGPPRELSALGPDPLEGDLGWSRLGRLLAPRRTRLKPLLMDQAVVAGIGNIYSDEILFAAGLGPDRPAASLDALEVRRLHRAMATTLRRAVEARGSSLADGQYRDLYGRLGNFQLQHRVYGKTGQPCRRCRTPIVRQRSAGRSSFSCPACQV